MAGWIIDTSATTASACSVHNNSGEFTYGGCLTPKTPSDCGEDIKYDVRTYIESGTSFGDFIEDYGNISKAINANSCNQEMLVMWFDETLGTDNVGIVEDTSIFDIENIDEGRYIRMVSGDVRIPTDVPTFEVSAYTESGYPYIDTDPCADGHTAWGNNKYSGGTSVDGHKVKFHTKSNVIPSGIEYNDGNQHLVEIYFPHYEGDKLGTTITEISSNAFKNCHRLSAITFSQVEEIESEAFANCYGLKKIDWGHVNCCTSNLRNIGTSGFTNCSGLTELCLDKLVKIETIGAYGFYGCKNVTSFSLPTASAYTAVTEHCFEGLWTCPSFTIPTNIKRIETCAFGTWIGDRDISSIIIPSSVTYIGSSAFSHTNVVYNLKWTASELNSVNIQTDAFSYNGAGLPPYAIMCPRGTLQAYKNYFNSRGMTEYAEKVSESS